MVFHLAWIPIVAAVVIVAVYVVKHRLYAQLAAATAWILAVVCGGLGFLRLTNDARGDDLAGAILLAAALAGALVMVIVTRTGFGRRPPRATDPNSPPE